MSPRKVAFLFAGQGAQYYQMGRGLYERNACFRAHMDRMDRLAREPLGASVVATLYGPAGKAEPFTDIRFTHPAIFMVEFALARTLIEAGIEPACTLGASLGTFAALAIAGRWSMEQALASVIRQALALERHGPAGGMIAVLGAPALYEASPFLQARAVIAGRNFASHFVLAAPEANLDALGRGLVRLDLTSQTVPVRYPFHSPWIEPMRDLLGTSHDAGAFRPSAIPVFCCAHGAPLGEIADDYFWQVARREIAFMTTIDAMERTGPFDYLDCSPTGTLSTFLKYLLPASAASRHMGAMAPFGDDLSLLESVVARLRPASARAVPHAAGR
ncbi:acyltransferase domain-containing protein [Burkholderia sp. F1]|uniref:acyltransferase domain-containing protein n=1 Tax=Burkholderia sp. F1 TaxID=3366817 RepID=UPI003D70F72B